MPSLFQQDEIPVQEREEDCSDTFLPYSPLAPLTPLLQGLILKLPARACDIAAAGLAQRSFGS